MRCRLVFRNSPCLRTYRYLQHTDLRVTSTAGVIHRLTGPLPSVQTRKVILKTTTTTTEAQKVPVTCINEVTQQVDARAKLGI